MESSIQRGDIVANPPQVAKLIPSTVDRCAGSSPVVNAAWSQRRFRRAGNRRRLRDFGDRPLGLDGLQREELEIVLLVEPGALQDLDGKPRAGSKRQSINH